MNCYYGEDHGPAEWFTEIDSSWKCVCGDCCAANDIKVLGDDAIMKDMTIAMPLRKI
jgi:hypothetical protein